ncbi:hypothetical protein [Klebsiella grimontii]|uniref:hypothetical protein n=1 Tax=Klebsiella grimontii TaxID=2058152 RepID=UPI0022447A64|nr:hypothetical protein [Klebsiella grimontii]
MLKQETSEVARLNTTSSLPSFFSTTALFMLPCALSGAIVGGKMDEGPPRFHALFW